MYKARSDYDNNKNNNNSNFNDSYNTHIVNNGNRSEWSQKTTKLESDLYKNKQQLIVTVTKLVIISDFMKLKHKIL